MSSQSRAALSQNIRCSVGTGQLARIVSPSCRLLAIARDDNGGGLARPIVISMSGIGHWHVIAARNLTWSEDQHILQILRIGDGVHGLTCCIGNTVLCDGTDRQAIRRPRLARGGHDDIDSNEEEQVGEREADQTMPCLSVPKSS